VLVNPTSGGGRAARARPHVESLLRKHGVEATFAESRSTEDVRRIAAGAAGQGYDVLAVLGGDGTAHHAFNAAFASGVTFGVFPAGNGNDIARALGLPLDPFAAARAFARGRPRAVDALRATTADGASRLFFAAGGLGLDAATAALVNGRFRRLPGVARYVAAALWALRGFRPFPLEVVFDAAPRPLHAGAGPAPAMRFGPSLLAAVANGPWYGAGVCIAPCARMDDGLLDLAVLGELPFLRVLDALPIVLRDGDLRWPEVQRARARRVHLRPAGDVLFHGDGEVLGAAPVTVEVLPRAFRITC